MSKEAPRFVDRPLVYIAAPYSKPDPVENTHKAIGVAAQLVDEGRVTPLVPHLTLVWHLLEPRELTFWYEYDLALLARCDAVLRLPGDSTGADAETAFALTRDLPVFNDVESLSAWAEAALRRSASDE